MRAPAALRRATTPAPRAQSARTAAGGAEAQAPAPAAPARRPPVKIERIAAKPTIARSPAPQLGRTTGHSLAAATGAPLVESASGRSTVQFGPSDLPATLARAEAEQPTPIGPAAPVLARSPSSGPTIARAAGGGGASGDSYDEFLDRLRRDLLREREQSGDLLGDRQW